MKSEERRMKNVFYLHPDGIILHSTFFILHFYLKEGQYTLLQFLHALRG